LALLLFPSIRTPLSPAALSFPRLLFYSGHSSFGMYCMMFLVVSFSADLLAVEPQPGHAPSLSLNLPGCAVSVV
jgi:hypothetical protein